MQIGEFASVCKTKISVLRHYDKEGLLKPDYIDRFTGYRYYTKEQIPVFIRIKALKKAGFSLAEIKNVISSLRDEKDVLSLFQKKRTELNNALSNLKEAEKMMLGDKVMVNVIFEETTDGIRAKIAEIDGNDFNKTCEFLEKAIAVQGYQRISNYLSFGQPLSNEIQVVCDVVKLKDRLIHLNEDTNLPFVNDEAVIGKWETIGEFAVKDDFFAGQFCGRRVFGDTVKEIYFLPNGERYWCYGWTKGKLILDTGDGSSVNDYTVETIDGKAYMFVDLKSYNYRRGGKTTVLVLKQLDSIAYSANEISRKDNINKPFITDTKVLGKWRSAGFLKTKDDFSPDKLSEKLPGCGSLFFKNIEFYENGNCTSIYGAETISGQDMQTWTKGFVLRKWNSTACAYEIRTINKKEYLIMEWKSGDYRWGGMDTDYYVFVRE